MKLLENRFSLPFLFLFFLSNVTLPCLMYPNRLPSYPNRLPSGYVVFVNEMRSLVKVTIDSFLQTKNKKEDDKKERKIEKKRKEKKRKAKEKR